MGTIRFFKAGDIQERIRHFVEVLGMGHIDLNRIVCIRSVGSSARYTLARCYGLGRVWQKALDLPAYYIIEIISEKYDKLSPEEKDKILLHELMHVPHAFAGGFRHHTPYVNNRTVNGLYDEYLRRMRAIREKEGGN